MTSTPPDVAQAYAAWVKSPGFWRECDANGSQAAAFLAGAAWATAAGGGKARELAAEAWHQFLLSAVSQDAERHEIFGWAYMAGWAHDKWPAVRDIVPPPDVTRCTGATQERKG